MDFLNLLKVNERNRIVENRYAFFCVKTVFDKRVKEDKRGYDPFDMNSVRLGNAN